MIREKIEHHVLMRHSSLAEAQKSVDAILLAFEKYIEEQKGSKERLKPIRFKRVLELCPDLVKAAVLTQELYEWALDDLLKGLKEGK